MLNLKDREWRVFIIEDLFDIKTVKGLPIEKFQDGKLPYISTSAENNGLVSFVTATKNEISSKNAISINPINGKAFYHEYDFVGRGFSGASINLLYRENMNRHIALFLTQAIEHTATLKASYANLFNSNRLRKGKFLLPVNANEQPNWQFMEQYAHEREQLQLKEYTAHAEKILADIGHVDGVLALKEKEWKPFVLSSIFRLETGKGKGLNHLIQTPDGVSYLGATNRNNGVLCYVKPDDKLLQQGNGIAFIRNGEGSIGYCVYKSEQFIASSDLTIGYSDKLNRYSGLFITTIADTVRGKYNFNYKRSEKRLSKEFLNLPINEFGEPDWVYMEQYTKTITNQQLKAYLGYVCRSLS